MLQGTDFLNDIDERVRRSEENIRSYENQRLRETEIEAVRQEEEIARRARELERLDQQLMPPPAATPACTSPTGQPYQPLLRAQFPGALTESAMTCN